MASTGNDKEKTPSEFRRKISSKHKLVNFGVDEYLEFVLLRELEVIEQKDISLENFSQKNLLSILFVLAGPILQHGRNAHILCESDDKPTAMEVFVSTIRMHLDITMSLLQALQKAIHDLDVPQFHILQANLSNTSDIDIADRFVNDPNYSVEETPTDGLIQSKRTRLSSKRDDWLRLRKKYQEKFCYPPPD